MAPGALAAAADGSPVVILGTGLTMLDAALSVTTGHPDAVVHAVSRHGLLPQVHRPLAASGSPFWLPALSDSGPLRLPDLLWQVRAALPARPGRWPEVIDGLRPHVPALWQRLPERDKRLFLRHVARYWEVHRHRAPPATAARITALRSTGRLVIHRAHVTGITEVPPAAGGPLRVRLGQGPAPMEIAAGWLVNATGPDTDITRTADPLVRDLLATGLARPGPLGLGLDASPDGAVLGSTGTPTAALFTLGPPLRGRYYETTAIPEIRAQAAALARHLAGPITTAGQAGMALRPSFPGPAPGGRRLRRPPDRHVLGGLRLQPGRGFAAGPRPAGRAGLAGPRSVSRPHTSPDPGRTRIRGLPVSQAASWA